MGRQTEWNIVAVHVARGENVCGKAIYDEV